MCTTLGLLQRGLKYIDTSEAEEMSVSRESERSVIEHCLIGKESEETFPFSEQCLRFKKTDFYF